jgi:hypothetical protein
MNDWSIAFPIMCASDENDTPAFMNAACASEGFIVCMSANVLFRQGTIEVRPLSSMDEIDLLSEWYPVGDPVSEALGLTAVEWKLMGRHWLSRCIGNGLSFVAYVDGNLAGCMISEMSAAPPELPAEARMDTIIAMMGDLEKSMHVTYPSTCQVLMAATRPDLRHSGVLTAMGRYALTIRPPVPIIVMTSNSYSRRACERTFLTKVGEIRYDEWTHEGRKPFASIPPPHTSMCLFMLGTTLATVFAGVSRVGGLLGYV